MKNKIAYLGFLGILGLLGLYWGSGHSMFLLFFFFFAFRNTIPDELFKENMRRSATKALTINLTLSFIVLAISTTYSNLMQVKVPSNEFLLVMVGAFIIIFTVSCMAFIFTLMYYNYKEKCSLE